MLHNFQRCLEKNTGYETDYMKILYYDLEEGYQGTYRSYEYNRICTIMDGKKHVTINQGDRFVYTPSEFILLPPHASVEMAIRENTKAIVYEVSDQIVERIIERVQNQHNQPLLEESPNGIHTHALASILSPIQRINQTLLSKDPDKDILIDLYAQELVYHLYKNNFIAGDHPVSQDYPVEYALKYMQEHICESISLTQLAKMLNMSPSHFSTTFKKSTGFSPKEYFNMIKVKKSKHLLKGKQVTEVAYELGYENISYFIHLFKEHFGETPKKYAMRTGAKQHRE